MYVFTGPRPETLLGVERSYGDQLPDEIRGLRHIQGLVSRGIVTWYPDPQPTPAVVAVVEEPAGDATPQEPEALQEPPEQPETDVAPVETASTRAPGPRRRKPKAPPVI